MPSVPYAYFNTNGTITVFASIGGSGAAMGVCAAIGSDCTNQCRKTAKNNIPDNRTTRNISNQAADKKSRYCRRCKYRKNCKCFRNPELYRTKAPVVKDKYQHDINCRNDRSLRNKRCFFSFSSVIFLISLYFSRYTIHPPQSCCSKYPEI